MFVRMTWKEAEERFNKKQDFVMAGENPYKSMKFRARDFWDKWGSFMRVMEEVAALGGFIGLGSDAGAFRVPHVAGTLSEEKWLRQTLGEETDAILTAAEKQVKSRFQPAKRGT